MTNSLPPILTVVLPVSRELSVAKVAAILSQSSGITLKEIIDGLGVSRQTTIRWLALMEEGGYLYKTHRATGMKGRPLGIYHPTQQLADFLKERHHRSAVMIDFPVMSALCRFNLKGKCSLTRQGSERCGMEICPLLTTPLL